MVWGEKKHSKRKNPIFAPRLTEEKERDEEGAQQLLLDDTLLSTMFIHTGDFPVDASSV